MMITYQRNMSMKVRKQPLSVLPDRCPIFQINDRYYHYRNIIHLSDVEDAISASSGLNHLDKSNYSGSNMKRSNLITRLYVN